MGQVRVGVRPGKSEYLTVEHRKQVRVGKVRVGQVRVGQVRVGT